MSEKLEHLLIGSHDIVIPALKKYNIHYVLEDMDIYITDDSYHVFKNQLAWEGVI